jgi:hypothetical protein
VQVLGGSFYGLLIAKISAIVAEAEGKQRLFNKRMVGATLSLDPTARARYCRRTEESYVMKNVRV